MPKISVLRIGLQGPLLEVAKLFFKLGCIAFGGPAAHIAMMRDEVVTRRKWLTDQEFLDLLGATNLIPGPNSTEMAIHLGYRRAGWPGLIVGGAAFILPAMLIVLGVAWSYFRWGTTPQANWLLYGIKPVIIAVVLQALWGLSRTAFKNLPLTSISVLVLGLYILGFNEIALMFGAGLLVMVGQNLQRLLELRRATLGVMPLAWLPVVISSSTTFSLAGLFLTFLKIGSVLYGSGYVLLAFLRNDFVERLGWLTNAQLLDAVAVGQVTPGPVFTTATFIGYVLGGVPGALLATLGIFLPGFVFVAITNPIVPKLRLSPWMQGLLDGVNVAAVGLMAAVTWELGRSAIVDPLTAVLALVAALLLIRWRVNSAWLVVGGGILGLLAHMLGFLS